MNQYSRRDILKLGIITGVALSLKIPSHQSQSLPTTAVLGGIYSQRYPFVLPSLGYDFDAVEPSVDARTMQIHYEKHHGAYVKNLNAAIASDPVLQKKTLGQILQNLDQVPEPIRDKVRNNGGGHLNHSLFWPSLKKGTKLDARSEFEKKIQESFGSLPGFLERFAAAAMGVFGSGWAWLIHDKSSGKLRIVTSPNQDNPWLTGVPPLLGIDVWEHAYYLKYQNRRADYVKAFGDIINWDEVQEKYQTQLSV